MFRDVDIDRLVLGVFDGDRIRLVDGAVLRVHFEAGAFALAGYVEGAAGSELDLFVFGGVVDGVFSYEFHLTVGVAAIEAHGAGGKRHAEVILFAVGELLLDADLFATFIPQIGLGVGSVAYGAGQVLFAIVDVFAGDWDAGGADEFDLLGLAVFQRHLPVEIVEVVVVEGFLADLRRFHGHRSVDGHGAEHGSRRWRGHGNIAGHQLHFCVGEVGSAVVADGDPADEVHGFISGGGGFLAGGD